MQRARQISVRWLVFDEIMRDIAQNYGIERREVNGRLSDGQFRRR